MIWKLQQVDGHGWVRDWFAERPVVTAREDEAYEFASWTDAAAVVALLPKEVKWRVVKREPRPGGPAGRGVPGGPLVP